MADNYSKGSKVLESGTLSGALKGGARVTHDSRGSSQSYPKKGSGVPSFEEPNGSQFNPMNHKASTYGVNGV